MMRPTERLVTAFLALLVAACSSAPARRTPSPSQVPASIPDAVPRVEPRSKSGNPPFYDVDGRRYFVLDSSAGFVERGVASWYGPDFHGGRTATGDKYDMYAMTAAHKTLPLPCHVRVTNLSNGRSVVVRVNDRGPFVANRIIDLSYAAATKLDILRQGTALVEVRVVDPQATTLAAVSPSAAPAATATRTAALDELYVQAGAFADQSNAERLLARLRASGVGAAFVQGGAVDGRTLYRVRVGPVPSVADFDRVVEELRAIGIPDARLALD
jgi:rare lipoprotein A